MVWSGPRQGHRAHFAEDLDARKTKKAKVMNAMKKPSRGPSKVMVGVAQETRTVNEDDEVMERMKQSMNARGETEARRHSDVGKVVFKLSGGRAHHCIGEVVNVGIRLITHQQAWTLAYEVRFENDEIVHCDRAELLMIKSVDA